MSDALHPAEKDALAEALCHEYHPMHWDVAYGNRNRACGACKTHAARLIASGWRVFPPGGRTLAEITADSERMADEAEAQHHDLPPDKP